MGPRAGLGIFEIRKISLSWWENDIKMKLKYIQRKGKVFFFFILLRIGTGGRYCEHDSEISVFINAGRFFCSQTNINFCINSLLHDASQTRNAMIGSHEGCICRPYSWLDL